MSNIRVSTVLVGIAALAFTVAWLLLYPGQDRHDTLAAVLFFAVLPVCALAGFASSLVILFRDRRPMRWVELLVSAALIALLARVH
jgi:hypothetical protein